MSAASAARRVDPALGIVVLGGGPAGMPPPPAPRRVDPALEIVVLEAGGYAAAGLCGLPYHLAGLVGRPDDLLAYPPAYFRERRGLDLRLHAEAVELDVERQVVRYRDDDGPPELGLFALALPRRGGRFAARRAPARPRRPAVLHRPQPGGHRRAPRPRERGPGLPGTRRRRRLHRARDRR